jgi:hypothetical protein
MTRITMKATMLAAALAVQMAVGAAPVAPPAAGSTPAYIYVLSNDGKLMWYRHDGAMTGAGANAPGSWQGSQQVGEDWNNFKQVFAGDEGSIYVVTGDGILRLYKHSGFQTGMGQDTVGGWLPPQSLSKGWGNFKQAFSGGGGVIYAIANNGTLKWYKHGTANGKATWEGPRDVGEDSAKYRQMFAGGKGILYALDYNGKLYWYKHLGYADGANTWESRKEIGSGWGDFKQIFCAGDGLFYAIKPNGELVWYREYEHQSGVKAWLPEKIVGSGWNGFQQVFALLSSRPVVPVPSTPAPPGAPAKFDPKAPVIFSQSTDIKGGAAEVMKEILKAPFISDLQVRPDTRNVVISFKSTQNSPPLVEIGKVAPAPDRYGIMAFGYNSGAFSRFLPAGKGKYSLNLDAINDQLDIGTTYYYIINVFNDNKNDAKRRQEQVSGQFTTLPQTVKVVWERVLIEDDSDEVSDGDISFLFWANYGQPSVKRSADYFDHMGSGHNYYPNQTLVLENAPDQLSLAWRGQDDDDSFNQYNSVFEHRPCSGPQDTQYSYLFTVNGAKGEFDLSKYPGANVKVPFSFGSMPHGDLRFVVFGHLEITRPVP